jgi:hypothetical protein
MAEEKSSSSSAVGFWTSKEDAPATTEEIKVASYLIISAALDDFDPKISNMVPPKLIHFIDEVMDGAVTEASLKSAKEWLNTTGHCPHYINPVHAVLVSKYNLFPNMSETYTWRAKITAASSDRTRLCAS